MRKLQKYKVIEKNCTDKRKTQPKNHQKTTCV